MMKLEEKRGTEQLLKITCKVGHSLRTSVSRVAYTMFNIRAKNYISEKNDEIHLSRKGSSKNSYNTEKSSDKV